MCARDDISSESTLERELASLLSIRDTLLKALVARTRHEPYTREGVVALDLARWLLGEDCAGVILRKAIWFEQRSDKRAIE